MIDVTAFLARCLIDSVYCGPAHLRLVPSEQGPSDQPQTARLRHAPHLSPSTLRGSAINAQHFLVNLVLDESSLAWMDVFFD
jgi:hypothetical protein